MHSCSPAPSLHHWDVTPNCSRWLIDVRYFHLNKGSSSRLNRGAQPLVYGPKPCCLAYRAPQGFENWWWLGNSSSCCQISRPIGSPICWIMWPCMTYYFSALLDGANRPTPVIDPTPPIWPVGLDGWALLKV